MTKYFLTYLLCCCSLMAPAQIAFQHIFGNANTTYTRDIIQTSDTGYVIAGSSSGYGDFSANAFLMKLDSTGKREWTRYYGGADVEWAHQVLENPDKSIIFAGYTNSSGNGGYDILLVKTDSAGNPIWEKTYGGTDWDFAYSVVRTPEGDYLIAGETFSFGQGSNDAFLLKVNSQGDSLWMRTYGGIYADKAEKVIVTSYGKYVFTGTTWAADGLSDAWAVMTDTAGNVHWENTYGVLQDDFGMSLKESQTNGELLFIGSADSVPALQRDMIVWRTDSLGNLLCNWLYGGNLNDYGYDIDEMTDGRLLLVGQSYSFGYGNGDMMSYYGYPNCYWAGGEFFGNEAREEARAVKKTGDGGYVVAGSSETGSGLSNIYVVKVGPSLAFPPAVVVYFDPTPVLTPELAELKWNAYPNPVSHELHIRAETEGYEVITAILTDATGREIQRLKLPSGTGTMRMENYPQGMYILRLEAGHRAAYRKIVVTGER